MKRLPKIYASPISKHLSNKEVFTSSSKIPLEQPNDIARKIKEIFASHNYVYKANVIITTDKGDVEETIIGKKDNYLITIDNKKIDISSIKNINKKTS